MPNVSVYISPSRMPEEESLVLFTRDCTNLCTRVLKADIDKVHIIYIPILLQGRGQPASIEIKYRTENFRSPEVMADFVKELDQCIKQRFGFVARIRCFGFGPAEIHAIN